MNTQYQGAEPPTMTGDGMPGEPSKEFPMSVPHVAVQDFAHDELPYSARFTEHALNVHGRPDTMVVNVPATKAPNFMHEIGHSFIGGGKPKAQHNRGIGGPVKKSAAR